MVPDCTNNSRKTAGISCHRVPAEKRLGQAWLFKIRRANPCSRDNSFVCSEHFTHDSFKENLPGLVYILGSADNQSDTEIENDDAFSENSPVYQRKFIVFEEQLDKLFVSCSTCHKPITENSKTLLVVWLCYCHHVLMAVARPCW